ncbi:MAG: serine/threonine protein kinase [Myxococcota bacterium]|nr:serine/threonine protein kinase [Myxococcota bacterium]
MAATNSTARFGKYALVDRLAVGGMAEIFLAREESGSGPARTIVLKRIRPHLTKVSSFVKMFLNEARLAAQLNHPNIVQIHDLGKVADSYYIAMEYISGRDMRRVIPRAAEMGIAFPLVYALKIASSVCQGLSYAHQKTDLAGSPLELVHRDITPENILVSFDGGVKILDFGIAKASNQVEQTRAGEIKGKLSYMSPEQASGLPLDARSDLFSLGVVLYEWLTGYRLFKGESEVAVLKTISEGRIHAPSYFRPEIPDEVERIVMRALEKDRDRRYQTAWEFQQDLDRYLAQSEFTPSNLHLSNFLRQLFFDELEVEKARQGEEKSGPETDEQALDLAELAEEVKAAEARARENAAAVAEKPWEEGQGDEQSAEPEPRGTEQLLALPLAAGELKKLGQIATLHQTTPEALVREILSSWLKYR